MTGLSMATVISGGSAEDTRVGSLFRSGGVGGLLFPAFIVASLSVAIGCGPKSEFPLAPVSGTVVFEGQPVTAGHLQFAPAGDGGLTAGKVATADIKGDGSFTFGSYSKDDGAVIGTGQVFYLEPATVEEPPPDADKRWRPTESAYMGLVPKDPEVTVAEGPNTLVIELVRP